MVKVSGMVIAHTSSARFSSTQRDDEANTHYSHIGGEETCARIFHHLPYSPGFPHLLTAQMPVLTSSQELSVTPPLKAQPPSLHGSCRNKEVVPLAIAGFVYHLLNATAPDI